MECLFYSFLIGQFHILLTSTINKQINANWFALTENLYPFNKETQIFVYLGGNTHTHTVFTEHFSFKVT